MTRTSKASSFLRSTPIEIIQLYRAISAIVVLLYHHYLFSLSFLLQKPPEWFRTIFEHGNVGVDFFFVLSGFIIFNAHYQDGENIASIKNYALKRIIRILPAYTPISIFLLVIYKINPNIGLYSKENVSIISSIFLVPFYGPTALGVAWTLIHEMIFYMVFITYFLWRKIFPVIIGLWALTIGMNVLLSLGLISNLFSLKILSTFNLEFVGGLMCAVVWRRVNAGTITGIVVLLSGVISLVMIVGFDVITDPRGRCILTVPFALILLGGCYLEKGAGLTMPRPVLFMGDASYTLYLIHIPLMSVMFRVVPAINRHMGYLGPTAEWAVTVFLSTALSILAGVLYHTLYERPALGFLRRKALHP